MDDVLSTLLETNLGHTYGSLPFTISISVVGIEVTLGDVVALNFGAKTPIVLSNDI